MDTVSDYVTDDVAAQYLDVDKAVIHRWASLNWIRTVTTEGSEQLYYLDDVHQIGEVRFGPQYYMEPQKTDE